MMIQMNHIIQIKPYKVVKLHIPFLLLLILPGVVFSVNRKVERPEFSTGGFFLVENAGREVYNFNVGWRFYKGSFEGAEKTSFDDQNWTVVNLPHGLELLPDESSGSMNYQGEAWYRKKFTVPDHLKGQKVYLNFEAIMGKSKVWVNGEFIEDHYGGYLPFILDVSDHLKYGEENVVAVLADNSDDTSYPPGQSQKILDFTYFGGIYRDVWLIAMDKVHITNPNYRDRVAGGGLFIHYENLSEENVTVVIETEIENGSKKDIEYSLETILKDKEGNKVGESTKSVRVGANKFITVLQEIKVTDPLLWCPQKPYLYDLFSFVKDQEQNIVDGIRTRVGIRKIEFRGRDGFYLNNKPYNGKLMGANRHQDFGYLGNALPNSLHWRDVKMIKDMGMDIIRTAHYPQDPAFMDACDELGLFYIEATPGWHFWSDDSVFVSRTINDIRNTVRRNRNRPSVLIWEPILNEAPYPKEFAIKANQVMDQEYPYPGCYTASDFKRPGSEYFDIYFTHAFQFDEMHQNYHENTMENQKKYRFNFSDYDKPFFVREYGDCVESFRHQNAPNRAHRSWGEIPQLVQAQHLLAPDYIYSSYESITIAPRQLIGGCIWHVFDHQRGYFPDTFYGGVADIFRQPKYAYYMYKSQRRPGRKDNGEVVKPMVFIAHEMAPFSPSDVVVFSNCEEVRLSLYGEEIGTLSTQKEGLKVNYPAIFEDVYRFYDMKARYRSGRGEGTEIVAEGIIDGEVVVTSVKQPSLKATDLKLNVDYSGYPLTANGSDIIVVSATITDINGNVKRLNNKYVKFKVTGEGKLIDDGTIHANPRRIEWGTAPALIQSTTKPGEIYVTATLDEDYLNIKTEANITLTSRPTDFPMLFTEEAGLDSYEKVSAQKETDAPNSKTKEELERKLIETQKRLNDVLREQIERDQENIGGTRKDSK